MAPKKSPDIPWRRASPPSERRQGLTLSQYIEYRFAQSHFNVMQMVGLLFFLREEKEVQP